jgi:hypothetical protein
MNGVALKQDFSIIKNNPLAPQTTGVVQSAYDEVCCFDNKSRISILMQHCCKTRYKYGNQYG